MRFVTLKSFIHSIYNGIRLVICRRDLPINPRWREQGYPHPNCWEIDEFFSEASKAGRDSLLYREARRIYWEAYWRLLGRYKGGKPFFKTYIGKNSKLEPLENRQKWVLKNIILSAITHDIVPEEAKTQTHKLYTQLYGPLTT